LEQEVLRAARSTSVTENGFPPVRLYSADGSKPLASGDPGLA
jgi:hypothetical protein